MKLLELYTSMLKTAGMVVSDTGHVSGRLKLGSTETTPVTVEGKRLVLPKREQLSNPDWENRVVFHPLSENILRGESKVVEKFRMALTLRINMVLGRIIQNLLTVAASKAVHPKLTPDQSALLAFTGHIDDKTVQHFDKIHDLISITDPTKSLVSIYLKRSGAVHGKKYKRAGIVTFPIYEDLKKGDHVFGVKLRAKDREILTKLLEFIFPGIEEAEKYNRGSDSEVAPYVDALMKTMAGLASPLNDLIEGYKGHLEDADDLLFESEWMETFDNLEVMWPEIRAIPMQAGNEGASLKEPTPAPAPAPSPANPVFASAPAPAPVPSPVPAPQYMGQPQYPQAQYPAQQPAAQVRRTERGVDFDSLMQARPDLARQAGVGFNPSMMQPMQPAERQPRWAQPQYNQPMGYGQQPQYGYGQQPQQQYGYGQPMMPNTRI